MASVMKIPRRGISQFYAAFYKWSRYTQLARPCAIPNICHRQSLRLFAERCTRNYHATRSVCQQEKAPIKAEGTGAQANVGQSEVVNVDGDGIDMEAGQLRSDVRLLMRKVPSSVAVITVAHFDPELNRSVAMGVAVSSLTTVTLDPPTVCFNIKRPSKTLDAIRAAKGRFRIHFPAADRGGASIVELFCRGNHHEAYIARSKELRPFVPGNSQQRDMHQASPSNAPQLIGNSIRAAMECTLTHELPVADHVVLVASVDSLECKPLEDRTILYVDGCYMRADGTKVISHGKPIAESKDTWVVWNYDLFPGEVERRDYMERIKVMAREKTNHFEPGKETIRELEATLAMSPGVMGINLEVLVERYRKEAGMPYRLYTHLMHAPILSEFYGRITPSDKAKIGQRAKTMMKEDPHFLSLNYRIVLQNLGISSQSINILPSDILGPLRAEGLAAPFRSRVGSSSIHSRDYTMQYLEQVERRLVEHFAAMGYETAMATRLDNAMESIGEQKIVSTYFKRSRARLHSAASPQLFTAPKIDIAGHLSQEDVRVVMSRVIHYLNIDNAASFPKLIGLDYNESLRRAGIHPCITGFNVEFFFGKIKHIFFTTRFSRDVAARIDSMLEPWFTSTVTWDDLEARVRSFVQKMPHRAILWPNRDKLAAMGLTWDAILKVPIAPYDQFLKQGYLLDTLVAKELKTLYASSTDGALKSDIARYLRQQYNFDVHNIPVQDSTAGTETKSSGDDIETIMKAHLKASVPHHNKDKRSAAGSQGKQGKNEKSGRQDNSDKQRGGKGSWTSYSLGGEQQ
ncbi:flavin reductase like domain-containing protein [Phaeosphaeriaceae sp. PMI808]|nr:flavin reductase like domain-containing protein [Phaeosphaeriaceae sp. PMI808]